MGLDPCPDRSVGPRSIARVEGAKLHVDGSVINPGGSDVPLFQDHHSTSNRLSLGLDGSGRRQRLVEFDYARRLSVLSRDPPRHSSDNSITAAQPSRLEVVAAGQPNPVADIEGAVAHSVMVPQPAPG